MAFIRPLDACSALGVNSQTPRVTSSSCVTVTEMDLTHALSTSRSASPRTSAAAIFATDPDSPHVDHGVGWRGALRGLAHAHVGWLFIPTQRGNRRRYAPDLLADPVVSFVDRTFVLWALGGNVAAFALGWLIGGSLTSGLTGLLWGGAVRLLVLHHATFSINSLCHFFGRKHYETDDESRNLAWLSLITFGEAWHNNHHAFPTSARHGLGRWQVDISAAVIRILERVGLVWDVVRISPERLARKAAASTPS